MNSVVRSLFYLVIILVSFHVQLVMKQAHAELEDIGAGEVEVILPNAPDLTVVGNSSKVFFSTEENSSSVSKGIRTYTGKGTLRVTNGTQKGTDLLAAFSISSRTECELHFGFSKLGELLYFRLNNNGYQQLWKTDGTATGTSMVKSLGPCIANGNNHVYLEERRFFSAGGLLYFSSGGELWKSNGTPDGTKRLKDICPGVCSSFPAQFTEVNGTIFFTATNRPDGRDIQLWKSNGTSEGTQLVKAGFGGQGPLSMTKALNQLFFSAAPSSHPADSELWKSNGTSTGTVRVKDIFPGNRNGSEPSYLTELNGNVYFSARNGSENYELWMSNGTSARTVMVKDILRGNGGSLPQILTKLGTKIYFTAVGINQLWSTDGTANGTKLVNVFNSGDIRVLRASSQGDLFVSILRRPASTLNNDEIWVHDPDGSTTTKVTELEDERNVGIPFYQLILNNLFMTVIDRESSILSLQRFQLP